MVACVLLSTRNMNFVRSLVQIIRLKEQFSNYAIKTIRLASANASEFTSPEFNNYCLSAERTVEHLVARVHTQNDIAMSLI